MQKEETVEEETIAKLENKLISNLKTKKKVMHLTDVVVV
jgi:hypothetical protein